MSEREIRCQLELKIEKIAKEIYKGHDIEIKTCNGGLKILSADKKVIR